MHNIFGLQEFNEKNSKIILLPVPWEVTTSYGSGASLGPKAILKASSQIDLCDSQFGEAYHQGIYMRPIPEDLKKHSDEYKTFVQSILKETEHQSIDNNLIDSKPSKQAEKLQEAVNSACLQVNEQVYQQCLQLLQQDKIVGVIGGDHSTPHGFIRAIHEHYKGEFGILHIDAHADLRKSYQGFTCSHASIMRNVMDSSYAPKKLVQVAIRDFCQEEKDFISKHPLIHTFFDYDLKKKLFNNQSWKSLCDDIVSVLPENVYISLDIDGLSPDLCPNTGTPVPGGLNFEQTVYLISSLHKHKKRIIGFDLVEVAPAQDQQNEWDGNVGARVLYQLCGWTLKTH